MRAAGSIRPCRVMRQNIGPGASPRSASQRASAARAS
jgi:hypothetical protein